MMPYLYCNGIYFLIFLVSAGLSLCRSFDFRWLIEFTRCTDYRALISPGTLQSIANGTLLPTAMAPLPLLSFLLSFLVPNIGSGAFLCRIGRGNQPPLRLQWWPSYVTHTGSRFPIHHLSLGAGPRSTAMKRRHLDPAEAFQTPSGAWGYTVRSAPLGK